mmetsp:Transcript_157670/g.505625  ORF Transcript_157670/g.505625 Transcript_157670/m.505625 type:complete len:87 (-) Transcript_157670:571-831(-)
MGWKKHSSSFALFVGLNLSSPGKSFHMFMREVVLGHAVEGFADAPRAFGGVEVGQDNLRRKSVDDLALAEVVGDVNVLHGSGSGTT